MTEKRKNKKNKILLIFAFLFTEKSSMGSFQPLKTTKAVIWIIILNIEQKKKLWFDAADDIVLYVTRQIK